MNSSALRPWAPATSSVPRTTFTRWARARLRTSATSGRPFSIREALLGVVADAEEFGFVVQVIVEHQEVRVEVDAAPGHQFERGIVQEGAVLDGGTAGHDGGAGPIGGVRVDHGPQSLGRG